MNSSPMPVRVLTYVSFSLHSERIIQATMKEITTWELFTPHHIPPLVQIEELAPDVAVIDMMADNWQTQCVLIQQIRGISPHTQIVVLADETMTQRIFAALQSGAIGYVTPQRLAADFLTIIEDTRQERGNLNADLARLLLAHLSIFTYFLEHERTILTAFADGRGMQEVEMYLDIPAEFLQRHIGNILLKVANPPDDALIERATGEIEAYHEQRYRSSSQPVTQKGFQLWETIRTYPSHFWSSIFPKDGNILHRPLIKPLLKRAVSHLWVL